METSETIRFGRPGPLYKTLRARARAELKRRGLPRHGGGDIIRKALFILVMLASSYVLLVFFAERWWQVALSAFVLSQAIVLVGFNIMHDGGHGAFSDKRWLNQLTGRGLDLIGGNQTLWRHKHGVLHHSFTNLQGHDDDLDGGALLRMHPDQPWRPWHRFQALYAFPLYSLLAVHWVFSDFSEYFGRKVGGSHPIPEPPKGDAAVFLAFKLLWFTLAFVIPLTQHAWYAVIGVWLAVMLVVGFTLALVFQLAHIVEDVEFPRASDGEIHDEWALHQLKTTADFAPGNPFVRWYTGGLNFQVEHHLFAHTSHVRYPLLQPLVAETCAELGAPYICYPTVRAAVGAHLRQLRQLGRRPERLAGVVSPEPAE